MALQTMAAWCNSLTGNALFAVIVGFPNDRQRMRLAVNSASEARAKRERSASVKRKARVVSVAGQSTACGTPAYNPRITRDWDRYETHLPSLQSSPRPYPRLPGSHEDTRWPRCHQCAPCQGSQAPGGLTLPTHRALSGAAARTPSTPAPADRAIDRFRACAAHPQPGPDSALRRASPARSPELERARPARGSCTQVVNRQRTRRGQACG